jgi:hypothetical protein
MGIERRRKERKNFTSVLQFPIRNPVRVVRKTRQIRGIFFCSPLRPHHCLLRWAYTHQTRSRRGFDRYVTTMKYFLFFSLHAKNPCVTFSPVVGLTLQPPQKKMSGTHKEFN